LLIRTGGERRVSNFLLWDFAYTEIFFTETLWPDFAAEHLQESFEFFSRRVRRFGRVDGQLEALGD
jgi:undecaprenyl diphosphate synthase